jgi:hypothetical protein
MSCGAACSSGLGADCRQRYSTGANTDRAYIGRSTRRSFIFCGYWTWHEKTPSISSNPAASELL